MAVEDAKNIKNEKHSIKCIEESAQKWLKTQLGLKMFVCGLGLVGTSGSNFKTHNLTLEKIIQSLLPPHRE